MAHRPDPGRDEVHILPTRLDREVVDKLTSSLAKCPDLAFAYLAEVAVPGVDGAPDPALFVWLQPQGMRSVRASLNLVSEAVARSLPDDRYLDVVILNSAPELLAAVERTGMLVLDRDPGEHQRAHEAASDLAGYRPLPPQRRWWWPF